MPKGKLLTDFEKGQIAAYAESGMSKREIVCRINSVERRDSFCDYLLKDGSLYNTMMM